MICIALRAEKKRKSGWSKTADVIAVGQNGRDQGEYFLAIVIRKGNDMVIGQKKLTYLNL